MERWKCILWASTAAPLCCCPLPVRRRFQKGANGACPSQGWAAGSSLGPAAQPPGSWKCLGSSASALCVLVMHQAGARSGLSLPWAVDAEAASPFSQEHVGFYRWWAQGLRPQWSRASECGWEQPVGRLGEWYWIPSPAQGREDQG